MMARLKLQTMILWDRLLRHTSANYRLVQAERHASQERRSARTGNLWSDLYRGVGEDRS